METGKETVSNPTSMLDVCGGLIGTLGEELRRSGSKHRRELDQDRREYKARIKLLLKIIIFSSIANLVLAYSWLRMFEALVRLSLQ